MPRDVRRWWNWQEYLAHEHADAADVRGVRARARRAVRGVHVRVRRARVGSSAEVLREVADAIASAGTRLSSHVWRSASAGNLGGWQVARTLFLLNALLGAVAVEGGTYPNAWNKFVPKPMYLPGHPPQWNELTWPEQYPLAMNEMSFLLPQFLKEGRGPLDVLFHARVQPRLDEPRRLLVDRSAQRPLARRPARSPSRRPGARRRSSPTTCCRWGTLRSGTTSTPTSSTTASGSASASRCCARLASVSASRSPTRERSTRARSGRRTSSGSTSRGGSTPTARSASARSSSRRSGPARSSASTSTTRGSSSTPSRDCPSGRRRRGSPRSRGCGATAPSR